MTFLYYVASPQLWEDIALMLVGILDQSFSDASEISTHFLKSEWGRTRSSVALTSSKCICANLFSLLFFFPAKILIF